MAEPLFDPFALRKHTLHPALSHNNLVADDVVTEIFDSFLQSQEFRAWSGGTKSWQLEVFGDPGSGKTTFAAIASTHLPRVINGAETAIASVSICDRVDSASLNFVEDLFQCIHDSFDAGSNERCQKYQRACDEGKPIAERIECLIEVLRSSIPGQTKFLILDGYDRMNQVLQFTVDQYFSRLQESGVRLMTTWRVPRFCFPSNEECDRCGSDYCKLWWECKQCGDYLCYYCMAEEEANSSHGCGSADFRETYSRVSADLGGVLPDAVLIKKIQQHQIHMNSDICRRIIDHIKLRAGANITVALLYLEDILSQDNAASFNADRVSDRLPRTVVAFFNDEMKLIEDLPHSQRLPTLVTIAAATDKSYGIGMEQLGPLLETVQEAKVDLSYPRGIEDVLRSANGWLQIQNKKPRAISFACSPSFRLYVQEDYNDNLKSAKDLFEHSEGGESHNDTNNPPPEKSPPQPNDKAEEKQASPNVDHAREAGGSSVDMSTESKGSSREPAKQVCNFCVSSIFESTMSSGQHHVSARLARSAAEVEKCAICTSLYPHETLDSDSNWPLYAWSLQTSPRANSPTLRFRSIHGDLKPHVISLTSSDDYPLPSHVRLGTTTDPAQNGGYQIKEWIEKCVNDHAGCHVESHGGNPETPFLPTRLIDVETGDVNLVRLVETKVPGVDIKGPYCTLSHSWGPAEKAFLSTTVWNMAKHLIYGIHMSELPDNFQHAIEVTRFLGIRYIWIDSLTIVQKPMGDFKVEGELMHQVYRNSYCNLVAADSWHGYQGFYRQRNPQATLPVTYRGTGANRILGKKEWAVVPTDMWKKELLDSFIYTRAWVFQERMLSPRLLHFTKNQVFWDCETLSACEVFPNGIPFSLDHQASTDRHWRGRLGQSQSALTGFSGANDDESSYTFWMTAVESYTSCNITNQGDKAIAIWSIAKLIRDTLQNETYAVGMWSQFLEEQLAWRVRDVEKSERDPQLQKDIPSWSWASVKSRISPAHRIVERTYKAKNHQGGDLNFTLKETVKALDGQPKQDKDSVQPELASKALAITGHIKTGALSTKDDNLRLQFVTGDQKIEFDAFLDESLDRIDIDLSACEFVIIAATRSPLNEFSAGFQDDSNETAPPPTYSGFGILLTKRSKWFEHQQERLRMFKEEVAGREMDRGEGWKMEAFDALMLTKPAVEGELVYRRVGILQFTNCTESAWKELQRGEAVKFWLE
ncbi:unnamed protein product [Periconia digitata]|uniref:Heterokaryon incompatibility domain-containing protein n=1 Tax=Periconia digitata TaxID=1303443 RepID=A0A9W4XJ71_9PLEO|nr:unnamed protein product [Periconia digitata]